MEKTMKLKIWITVLMLAAAACTLVGKSIMSFSGGISLTYDYIDALFPTAETSFRSTTTVYAWLLLAGGVLAGAFVWLRRAWTALVACALCASSLIWHIATSIINGYSILEINGAWEFAMLALPLVAAVLCVILFRAARETK